MWSTLTYIEPTIDVQFLDLDPENHENGYIRYYTDGGSEDDHFDWYINRFSLSQPQYAEYVTNENIINILECLYSKYNIKSISVRKTQTSFDCPWGEYNYILNVRGHGGGGDAVFEWGDKDHSDTLGYIDERDQELCYNFPGRLTKITALDNGI